MLNIEIIPFQISFNNLTTLTGIALQDPGNSTGLVEKFNISYAISNDAPQDQDFNYAYVSIISKNLYIYSDIQWVRLVVILFLQYIALLVWKEVLLSIFLTVSAVTCIYKNKNSQYLKFVFALMIHRFYDNEIYFTKIPFSSVLSSMARILFLLHISNWLV